MHELTKPTFSTKPRIKMSGFLKLLIVLLCLTGTLTAPLSTGKVLFIEPKTISYHASFVLSTMTITDSNSTMHFPRGVYGEELLRVPLGVQDPHVVVRVTVALKPSSSPKDSDPFITLSDGTQENSFRIGDHSYELACEIMDGTNSKADLPIGTTQHYEYSFIFEPFQSYGACSHFGGHITPGYFNKHIDPSKGLDFVVKRENEREEFDFYFFLIEIL